MGFGYESGSMVKVVRTKKRITKEEKWREERSSSAVGDRGKERIPSYSQILEFPAQFDSLLEKRRLPFFSLKFMRFTWLGFFGWAELLHSYYIMEDFVSSLDHPIMLLIYFLFFFYFLYIIQENFQDPTNPRRGSQS